MNAYTLDATSLPDTTPDGLTWLDPQGKPPVLDANGHLTEPFVMICRRGDRCYLETHHVGLTLPPTARQHAAGVKALRAAKARWKDGIVPVDEQMRVYHAAIAELSGEPVADDPSPAPPAAPVVSEPTARVERPPAAPTPHRQRGKLSPADVATIRTRVAAGERNRAIAADFGIDPSTVSDIKGGRYHRLAS